LKQGRFGLAAAALVAAGAFAGYLAGTLASPFAATADRAEAPAVTWQPRVVDAQGRSLDRPFGELLALLARTEPGRRSASDLSAGEIADLLGRPSAAAIVPGNHEEAFTIQPIGRPQICAEYLPPGHDWYLVFCS
jgi:hypothetical protein